MIEEDLEEGMAVLEKDIIWDMGVINENNDKNGGLNISHISNTDASHYEHYHQG